MNTQNSAYSLGLLVGMLVALLVIGLICWAIGRRYRSSRVYDERQKLAQGQAYKWAFFTLIGYLMIAAVFDLATGIRWCDLFTFAFLGTLLSVMVFAIMCIAKDAYMPFSQNPGRTVWITGVIGLINTVAGVINLRTPGSVVVDGILTYRCVNLLAGLLLLGIAAAVLIKSARERRAAEG